MGCERERTEDSNRVSDCILCTMPPLQSPVLKTQTITISDVSNTVRGDASNKEVPVVHTETKTITYESAQVRGTLGVTV